MCGVVGVASPTPEAASLAALGIFALQHRGQESAGIAVSDGKDVMVYKDLGLVDQVIDERRLESLRGHLAIAHCRYSTTGSTIWENSQPTFRLGPRRAVAVGHNGNLVNTQALLDQLPGGRSRLVGTTDTELLTALLATEPGADVVEALTGLLPRVSGAYSLVVMDEGRVVGARDPYGFRPLVMGVIPSADGETWCLASETAALDVLGAEYVRDVEPGELVVLGEPGGPRSVRFAEGKEQLCVFELIYFARPDSYMLGRNLYEVRRRMGEELAREAPAEADLVMPVPDTGAPAAAGYAEASGIPYREGMTRNRYAGRTFIQPSNGLRQRGVTVKLSVTGLGVLDAKVRWYAKGQAGLHFAPAEEPQHRTPRVAERLELAAEVSLRRPGRCHYQVRLLDLSAKGCRLEFVERPRVGERLWVKFSGLNSIEAEVCWRDGFVGGVRFVRPIHPAVFDLLTTTLR